MRSKRLGERIFLNSCLSSCFSLLFLSSFSLPPSSPTANPPPAGGPVGGSDSPPDCHSLPPTALRLPSSEGGFSLRRANALSSEGAFGAAVVRWGCGPLGRGRIWGGMRLGAVGLGIAKAFWNHRYGRWCSCTKKERGTEIRCHACDWVMGNYFSGRSTRIRSPYLVGSLRTPIPLMYSIQPVLPVGSPSSSMLFSLTSREKPMFFWS